MRERMMIYVDTNGVATVLESLGQNLQELHSEDADMENWPEDLGVYSRSGLIVWEGEVLHDRDKGEYIFTGELRKLTSMEWELLRNGYLELE